MHSCSTCGLWSCMYNGHITHLTQACVDAGTILSTVINARTFIRIVLMMVTAIGPDPSGCFFHCSGECWHSAEHRPSASLVAGRQASSGFSWRTCKANKRRTYICGRYTSLGASTWSVAHGRALTSGCRQHSAKPCLMTDARMCLFTSILNLIR
jgi:hypothetical protein